MNTQKRDQGEVWTFSDLAEMYSGSAFVKNSVDISEKKELSDDLAILLLGVYPKNL